MSRKKTTEEFIARAIEAHGGKYDYSVANYTGRFNKITIICPSHGRFEQLPVNHYQGKGCRKCSRFKGGWDALHWTALQGVHKLYAIACRLPETGEEFIKIGKTVKPIVERFRGAKLPYEYTKIGVISVRDGYTEQEVSDLEVSVHKSFEPYAYRPSIRFSGSTECYNKSVASEKKFKVLFGNMDLKS